MGARVRIKDIAKKAGVSAGTVDRVLHKRGEVNEETRKKVMDIVKDIGYVPNLAAKSLASKKVADFVVLMPVADSEHAYWQMPLIGIQKAAGELKDFNASIRVFHFDPASPTSFSEKFEEAIDMQPEGIIFTPVFESRSLEFVKRCEELEIPLLCLEIDLAGENAIGYFGQDAEGSGRLAGKLMDQILPAESTILLLNLTRKMTLSPHLKRRSSGFMSYFKNPFFSKNMKLKSIDLDIPDQKILRRSLVGAFESDSNINGIYVTNSQVHRVAKSLKRLGKENVVLIGHDVLQENLVYLEDGIIDFLIAHRPQDISYKSVMAMFNHVNGIKEGDRINLSSIDVILKENINYYKNEVTHIK